MTRFLSYSCGFIALIIAIFTGWTMQYFGFPDGYLSEFDKASRVLYLLIMTVSLGFGAWFFYVGIRLAALKKPKTLAIAVAAYVMMIAIVLALQSYFLTILEHGTGG